MSTIINATTTNGVVIQPDNSGSLVLQTNNGTTALTIDTSQNATFAKSIILNGSTSGTVTVAAPAVSGTTTLTLPSTSGTVLTSASSLTSSQLPTGSVLQVVQSVKTDKFTTTSGSPTDVSGLSVSITPSSASSKFLVIYSLCVGGVVDAYIGLNLVRNGTSLSLGTSGTGSQTNVTTGAATGLTGNWEYKLQTSHYEYLDSPSTTSAITYKVQAFSTYGNREMTINKPQMNDNGSYITGASSSITVMEIKG